MHRVNLMWELNEERTYACEGSFTVRKRPSDYMAYTSGDTRTWECGKSPEEALGKLVMTTLSSGNY